MSELNAIKHGMGIQGHDFTLVKVELVKGSVDNTPTELITNGDLEGSDFSNFKYTDAKNNQWGVQTPIVYSQDGHGNIAQITAQRKDSDGANWDTKFTIDLSQSLPAGTTLKIKFDYKVSDGNFNISLGTNDSTGNYAEYISEVSFSTSWQTFEKTITTTKELKQIEMSLANESGVGKTFSFSPKEKVRGYI